MPLFNRDGLRQGLGIARLTGFILSITVIALHLSLGDDDGVPWRHDWWDAQHRMIPRERVPTLDAPAVVVAIDEATMQANGHWPWPRSDVAIVVEQMAAYGVGAVAFDILMLHEDPQSPVRQGARYRALGFEALAGALDEIGDTDEILYNAFRTVPTILPVSGIPDFPGVDPAQRCDFRKPEVTLDPPDLKLPVQYPAADAPFGMFLETGIGKPAVGLAAINFEASSDVVVRSVRAVQSFCDAPFLMLGAEAMRMADQRFLSVVQQNAMGLEVSLGDPGDPAVKRFPTESDGRFWLHFGRLDASRYISAQELFSPEFDPARIAGKIALLAVIDLGRIDERTSPFGQVIYGVEAHLQMIEQIESGHFLRRPWFLFWIEAAVLTLGCALIVVMVPRAGPMRALGAVVGGVALTMALSVLAFRSGVLLDMASVTIGNVIVAVGVLATTLVERDRLRLRSEISLQSERADRSLLQGELDAAARIQQALLPPRQLTRDGQIDLACYIDPARTVGGDFYDHFMVDEDHLFFLVADVSGKGADASQFMLLSKTLWKSVALRNVTPLERIQVDANAEITRENAATMFVTGLCGLLNLRTGHLSYSSCGHDSPYLFGDQRQPRQLDAFSGPPAGLVDGMEFPVGEITLKPGDRLCIFTDGVTEAMDKDGELFNLDRLEAALDAAPADLNSAGIVEHLVDRVSAFTRDAEQSDDLTLMVISIPERV